MANKKTRALTQEQYRHIITTLRTGVKTLSPILPNERVATALVLEANLGIRISDIVKLRLCDIIRDGERYRLDIIEQKTQKTRTFTVPEQLYNYIADYCTKTDIAFDERLFPITTHAVQKQLKRVCDHLGYEGISTHSFRKFFATNIYTNSNYNIVLVKTLLQHSSAATTERYIGIGTKELEHALEQNIHLY